MEREQLTMLFKVRQMLTSDEHRLVDHRLAPLMQYTECSECRLTRTCFTGLAGCKFSLQDNQLSEERYNAGRQTFTSKLFTNFLGWQVWPSAVRQSALELQCAAHNVVALYWTQLAAPGQETLLEHPKFVQYPPACGNAQAPGP